MERVSKEFKQLYGGNGEINVSFCTNQILRLIFCSRWCPDNIGEGIGNEQICS